MQMKIRIMLKLNADGIPQIPLDSDSSNLFE